MLSSGYAAVRVDDEFVCDARIECRITLGCFIESDALRIDDLGDRQPVPQDCLQQLAVIPQHRRLAGVKAVRLRPALPEAEAKRTVLRRLLLGAGIFGDIEAWNTDRT